MNHQIRGISSNNELLQLFNQEMCQLQQKLDGRLLLTGSACFTQAHLTIDPAQQYNPSFIVQAESMDDICVMRAFATRYDLPIALRHAGQFTGDTDYNEGILIDAG